jgi:hypothetical protein
LLIWFARVLSDLALNSGDAHHSQKESHASTSLTSQSTLPGRYYSFVRWKSFTIFVVLGCQQRVILGNTIRQVVKFLHKMNN